MRHREWRAGPSLEREGPWYSSVDCLDHWLAIYTALILLTEAMLALPETRMTQVPGPAQRRLQSADVRLLQEELTAVGRRKAALEHRRHELAGAGGAGTPGWRRSAMLWRGGRRARSPRPPR